MARREELECGAAAGQGIHFRCLALSPCSVAHLASYTRTVFGRLACAASEYCNVASDYCRPVVGLLVHTIGRTEEGGILPGLYPTHLRSL
ncbi:hypothetical protein BaRGS_00006784 [Batillaria attramentaria]|uniref:Uncharacterized protein n=1 Tax=Batillaria attramentaria TaxID=370345 RepID=A0ABD0LSK7_9CAEN